MQGRQKEKLYFVLFGSIPSTFYGNTHKVRQQMDKQFNLEPPKLRLHQLTKRLDAKIVPHISSLLRDLGVIFD